MNFTSPVSSRSAYSFSIDDFWIEFLSADDGFEWLSNGRFIVRRESKKFPEEIRNDVGDIESRVKQSECDIHRGCVPPDSFDSFGV